MYYMFRIITCTHIHTYTPPQTYSTVSYSNLKPSSFTVGVTLWVRGLGQVKPVVQIPLLFSAWLDCNFLGFGEQDTLPCTQENSPDVHLVPVCGQEIKDTHMHTPSTPQPPWANKPLATIIALTFKKYLHKSFTPRGHTPLHSTENACVLYFVISNA